MQIVTTSGQIRFPFTVLAGHLYKLLICDYIITGIHFFFSNVVQIFTFICGSVLLGGSLYLLLCGYFVKKGNNSCLRGFGAMSAFE